MRIRILIAVMLLLSPTENAFANAGQAKFDCDANGNLLSFQYGAEVTFDSAAEPKNTNGGESFEYSYPFDGYTKRNIGADGKNEMNKEQFRRVAELAVAGGVDPFLAMSILVTEQTPLQKNFQGTEPYFRGYGVFPVDARPAYSFLKCSVEKSEFAEYLRGKDNLLRPQLALLDRIRAEGNAAGGEINNRYNQLAHEREVLQASINVNPKRGDDPRKDRLRKMDEEMRKLSDTFTKAFNDTVAKLPEVSDPYQKKLMEQYVSCWNTCQGIMPGQCRKKEGCDGKEVPVFDFGPQEKAITRTYCTSVRNIGNGDAPDFSTYGEASKAGSCCYQIRAPENSIAFKNKIHQMGALGLKTFWDDKMLRALRIVKPRSGGGDTLGADDAHKLSRIAQMWNGWGRLNVTEKINTCMGTINMAESPVIGAKAMDLMVNSTLTNFYLVQSVMEAAKGYGLPVKSMLCLYSGAGKKKIDAKAFHSQLNGRYLSGTSCR